MFRVSVEMYEKLNCELEKAYQIAKDNREPDNIIRFNRLYFIDVAIKDLIEERMKELVREGVIDSGF